VILYIVKLRIKPNLRISCGVNDWHRVELVNFAITNLKCQEQSLLVLQIIQTELVIIEIKLSKL
jgi:hypothetical protein